MKYKGREKSFNIGAYIYPALGGEEGSESYEGKWGAAVDIVDIVKSF